ncbi:unnamed protein product [Sympodiomycopsis kandeliae]
MLSSNTEQPYMESTPNGVDTSKSSAKDSFLVNSNSLPLISENIPHLTQSYAGMIPMNKSRPDLALWFWLFPGETQQKDEPLIVWLPDGPGYASSRDALQQIGPVLIPVSPTEKIQAKTNPYSWTRLGSVLFVDCPFGTGFSTGVVGNVTNDADLAKDFRGFFDGFLDTFPEYRNRRIYIATQGWTAYDATYIADNFLSTAPELNLAGLIYITPSITHYRWVQDIPAYWFLKRQEKKLGLKVKDVEGVEKNAKSGGSDIETVEKLLQFPQHGPVVSPAYKYVYLSYAAEDVYNDNNDCFDQFDVTFKCPNVFDPFGFKSFSHRPSSRINFFNLNPALQSALHVPAPVDFRTVLSKTFKAHEKNDGVQGDGKGDHSLAPAEDNLSGKVWDKIISKSKSKTSVLIMAGKLDSDIIYYGTLLGIQNSTWSGMQGFQSKPDTPFVSQGTQLGTQHTERGLKWVEFDSAGRFVAMDHPEAVFELVQHLITRGE